MLEAILQSIHATVLEFVALVALPVSATVPAWLLRRRLSPVWTCCLAGLAGGGVAAWLGNWACSLCGDTVSISMWGLVAYDPEPWVEPALLVLWGGIWGSVLGMTLAFLGADPPAPTVERTAP